MAPKDQTALEWQKVTESPNEYGFITPSVRLPGRSIERLGNLLWLT